MAADDDIKLKITVEGAQQASQQIASVSGSTQQLSQSAADAEQRMIAMSTAQTAAATQAIQLMTRVGGASAAISALTHELGIEGSGSVGLIGKIAQTSAQMASLGMSFGPQGALVGGIIGAAIPAFHGLIDALEPLPIVQAHIEEETRSATAAVDAQATALRDASAAGREFVQSLTLRGARADLDSIQTRIELATQNYQRLADLGRGSGTAAAQAHFEAEDAAQEVNRLLTLASEQQDLIGTISSSARPARRGGGGRGSREREVDLSAEADRFRNMLDGLTSDLERTEQARMDKAAAEVIRVKDLELAALTEIAAKKDEIAASEAARISSDKNKAASVRAQGERDFQATMKGISGQVDTAANGIGQLFGNAFGSAIQGQEDFGKALEKGFKVWAIQFGSQQVGEGAAALLSAVGLAATSQAPAAAGKAIEGAGKIALGVSLGAAGAAVNTGAPAAPAANGNAPSNNGKSGTVVVNLNAPTVMGATHAETGRALGRSIARGNARFNGRSN